MKALNRLKVPFGTAKFCHLRNARYLTWRDAFEVEFEDGIAFLETHQAVKRANKIKRYALPVQKKLERKLRSGFPVAPKLSEGGFVHYDNGQTAEVSWAFIRELPPKNDRPISSAHFPVPPKLREGGSSMCGPHFPGTP